MDTIKIFRKCNKISQVALAEYLSVTQGFISQVEKGLCALPEWVTSKILENPYNWDTSAFKGEDQPQPELATDVTPQYSNTELLLRELLAEKEAKIDTLNEIIWELKAENARLAEQLRIKRGDAINAEDSLSATA